MRWTMPSTPRSSSGRNTCRSPPEVATRRVHTSHSATWPTERLRTRTGSRSRLSIHTGQCRFGAYPALQSTGPCQPLAYQPSQRVLPAPCQKTSCVEPSTVTVALGDEVSRPLPPKALTVKSTGPFHDPVYQDSSRCPAALL